MNEIQVEDIINVLYVAYPQSFKGYSERQFNLVKALWLEAFADYPGEIVASAVKAIINTDTREFAPNIAQVKKRIVDMSDDGMTEQEAWNIVRKAISKSGWHEVEEFNKLPGELKQIVGSASQLHNWSQMDANTINSVVASNFQRSYKAKAKYWKEIQMLPKDIKQLLGTATEEVKQIENKDGA